MVHILDMFSGLNPCMEQLSIFDLPWIDASVYWENDISLMQ